MMKVSYTLVSFNCHRSFSTDYMEVSNDYVHYLLGYCINLYKGSKLWLLKWRTNQGSCGTYIYTLLYGYCLIPIVHALHVPAFFA